jgi:hypothetical protein
MTMNVFRKVAVATIVVVAGVQIAAADSIGSARAASSTTATPGVYGRLDVDSKQSPPLVYEQAMFIEAPETAGKVQPVYLHVPPEHAKNWKKHCAKYQACKQPVYFVKSAEYEPGYDPKAAKQGEEKSDAEKPKRKFRSGW